jgi:hypothetical protein
MRALLARGLAPSTRTTAPPDCCARVASLLPGGVAALVRSPASFSIASPHTGSGGYLQDSTGLITAESDFGRRHPYFVGVDLTGAPRRARAACYSAMQFSLSVGFFRMGEA